MSISKLRWDDEYERCVGCQTRSQDKPHVAEGLCTECFPAKYGDFGLGDVRPLWAEKGLDLPPAPIEVPTVVIAASSWTRQFPHCLCCGSSERRHDGGGLCTKCAQASRTGWKRCNGVAVFWLPFAGDDATRYDHSAAKRWVVARDLAEAWAYLERRAAAGGIPTGGKAVIRAASKAGELPETVIRRAA